MSSIRSLAIQAMRDEIERQGLMRFEVVTG